MACNSSVAKCPMPPHRCASRAACGSICCILTPISIVTSPRFVAQLHRRMSRTGLLTNAKQPSSRVKATGEAANADKPASPVPSTSTEFKPFVLARDGNILLSNLSSLTSEVAEKSTIIESINGPRQFLENWPKGELKKVPYRMPSGILAKAVPITCSRTRIASPEGNAPNTCNHLNLPPTG